MRSLPASQTAIWKGGDFTGPNRSLQRATIQVIGVAIEKGHNWNYADYLFGQRSVPKELPNVRSIKWDRHIDTDAATMTMTLYNTEPLPMGVAVQPDDYGNYYYDRPGYFTFNRGLTKFTNRWHHAPNQWQGYLAPDRLIRTYEGYGWDATKIPEKDPHMRQSGVWLIDKVDYGADGLITVTARDAARMLIESIIFPPIIALKRYPLYFVANWLKDNPDIVTSSAGWAKPIYESDSGQPYAHPAGTPNYPVHGHYPAQAFDSSGSTYWLSIGNAHPRADYAFEWVQGKFTSGQSVRHVRFTPWGGPYVAYVSVFSGGKWQGAATVPYNAGSSVAAPNGANIRYVKRVTTGANSSISVDLGQTFTGVTKVRVCLTNLTNSGIGPYPYRGGIRDMDCTVSVSTTTDGGKHTVGDFDDYSVIVKQLLAWGGFHWPRNTNQAFITQTDGTIIHYPAPTDDLKISGSANLGYFPGEGRVWGDIESAGTAAIPQTKLDVEIWDKKPLMDGINYVKDVLGYLFFVDESGAAVFRSPNIWKIGNFLNVDYTSSNFHGRVFTDTFARIDSALIGNGWHQAGGDFFLQTQRAITRDATSWMGQNFGNISLGVEASLRTPDNMQPGVYAWGTSTSQGASGYCLAFAAAASGTNLVLRKNNVQVASKHIGSATVPIGNNVKQLRLEASKVGSTVYVRGYVDGALELKFQEAASASPTGTWSGVGNLGLAGTNGVSIDNVMIAEIEPTVTGSPTAPTYVDGAANLITIDENETLLSLSVSLSSHNQRDRVFVANVSGKIGATASGHYGPSGPFDANMRRVAGWTDMNFTKTNECQRMADLISLRQLFTYRTNQVRIPGYSAIQIDDQIRILEGTTAEDFIHYVVGISSEWDIESGEWTYTLDTHWLGENPETNWAFTPSLDLSADTILFLQAIGRL